MTSERDKSIPIEVNLRIPAVKQPKMDPNGYPINSADVRFIRTIDVPALPKPGTVLQLATGGTHLECEVLRADWSDPIERFVVYCKYAKRSMPPEEYDALLNDADWTMRPLL